MSSAKHNLTGLRFKMAYQTFSNFGEKLNADLNNKVMANIIDFDLMDRKCNCNESLNLMMDDVIMTATVEKAW